VNALSWSDVLAIAGPDVRVFARLVQEAYKSLMDANSPQRLVVGSFHAKPMGPNVSRVVTYRPYDPLAISKVVLDLLPYFDGRPTAQVLKRIRKEKGIALGEDLVRRLADFQILVPPPPPSQGE
jgi:hypothetical protein